MLSVFEIYASPFSPGGTLLLIKTCGSLRMTLLMEGRMLNEQLKTLAMIFQIQTRQAQSLQKVIHLGIDTSDG